MDQAVAGTVTQLVTQQLAALADKKAVAILRKIELKQVEQEAIAVAILPKTANAHKKLAALADKTHPGQL